MRYQLLLILLSATALLIAPADLRAASNPVWSGDSLIYNLEAERVFEGTIAGKGHILDGLLYFPLKTKDAVVDLQIAPKEFLTRSNFKLAGGDRVRVVGVRLVLEDRDIVLVREIGSANGVLVLRDDKGQPLWQDEPLLMDPERWPRPLEICNRL